MGLELLARLARRAAERGDAAAVCVVGPLADRHPVVTWRELQRQVAAVAAWCDATLSPGAGVMVVSVNRPAVVGAYLGVLASGRTLFPVDAALTEAELRQLAQRSGMTWAIVDEAMQDRVERAGLRTVTLTEVVRAPPETSASPVFPRSAASWLYLQSSGTTGGPKIVRRSGPSLDAVARNVARATGLRPDDRVLAAVPVSHSYGLENGLLAPVFAGACMLHHVTAQSATGRGFDPSLSIQSGATVLPGVPAIFEMIERFDAGRGRLRLAYSAGAPLPAALVEALEKRDGLRLAQLYGCTEIGSVTFGHTPHTVGRPMPDVSIRILPVAPEAGPEAMRRSGSDGKSGPSQSLRTGLGTSEGHVAIRSPSMFAGYLDPADDAGCMVDGHFLTGDLGRVTEAGELQITGRLKLLIDVGGVKVNPLEVEEAMVRFPGVRECIVLPDAVSPTINRVKAIVVPAGETLDEAALRSFLRERLAAHKVPRTFEVRRSLPKSATGKVLRQRLEVGV